MNRKKLDKNKKKDKKIEIDNVMRMVLEMGGNVLHIDKVDGKQDTFKLTKLKLDK